MDKKMIINKVEMSTVLDIFFGFLGGSIGCGMGGFNSGGGDAPVGASFCKDLVFGISIIVD